MAAVAATATADFRANFFVLPLITKSFQLFIRFNIDAHK
ncbi:hypothetical protein BIL_15730 [Bifidobacterium longum subsp. longum F8]|nr:hypothetical protein BIL_15730 [Bifidobacterium longum subsp. longum F8]